MIPFRHYKIISAIAICEKIVQNMQLAVLICAHVYCVSTCKVHNDLDNQNEHCFEVTPSSI